MVSNTRLYGAAISFASGGYSLWSVSTATEMTASAWLMGGLGVIVVVHGAVLLTDDADRLGSASGPLMIAYAVGMLANQVLLAAGILDAGGGMGGGGMGGETTMDGMMDGMNGAMDTGMAWDPGMVALAALMLASGLIMTRGSSNDGM